MAELAVGGDPFCIYIIIFISGVGKVNSTAPTLTFT